MNEHIIIAVELAILIIAVIAIWDLTRKKDKGVFKGTDFTEQNIKNKKEKV